MSRSEPRGDAPPRRLQQRSLTARVAETLRQFGPLGFISFGGPGVHVVLLRRRFVDELKWVSSATFNDLLSLGNALPGPGSTQLAFSIALVRNGTLPGLLAFCLWSFPAALGMTALAAGVRSLPESLPPAVLSTLSGVNAAAVGMIALASYQLALSTITDGATQLVFLFTAALSLLHSASWVYPVCVLSGGVLLLLWDYRGVVFGASAAEQQPLLATPNAALEEQDEVDEEEHLMTLPPKWGLVLVAAFVASVLVVAIVRSRPMGVVAEVFTSMFTAGTIIFGGGPVVIPLLRGYMVSTGLVSSRDFLLGFALLQSFPGPNFAFSCYLGGLAVSSRLGAAYLPLGSALAFVGIFYPGIALKLALLPAYKSWKSLRAVKSVLRGLAPAASGLVLAAVWQLFQVGNLHATPGSGHTQSGSLASHPFWPIVAAFAFVLVKDWRLPPWLVVALGAAAGALKWKVEA